jgi:hypothetical protein
MKILYVLPLVIMVLVIIHLFFGLSMTENLHEKKKIRKQNKTKQKIKLNEELTNFKPIIKNTIKDFESFEEEIKESYYLYKDKELSNKFSKKKIKLFSLDAHHGQSVDCRNKFNKIPWLNVEYNANTYYPRCHDHDICGSMDIIPQSDLIPGCNPSLSILEYRKMYHRALSRMTHDGYICKIFI